MRTTRVRAGRAIAAARSARGNRLTLAARAERNAGKGLWLLACVADNTPEKRLPRLEIVPCDLPHDLGVNRMIYVTQAIAEFGHLLPWGVRSTSLDIGWNVLDART